MKLFKRKGHKCPKALLEKKDYPYPTYTLANLPLRLVNDTDPSSSAEVTDVSPDPREGLVVDMDLDALEVEVVPSPAEALANSSGNIDNWLTQTRSCVGRLFSAFLVAEDPFRRLDISPVSSL